MRCVLTVRYRLWHAVHRLRLEHVVFVRHYRLFPVFVDSAKETRQKEIEENGKLRKKRAL